jgi:hypothetical protein
MAITDSRGIGCAHRAINCTDMISILDFMHL